MSIYKYSRTILPEIEIAVKKSARDYRVLCRDKYVVTF